MEFNSIRSCKDKEDLSLGLGWVHLCHLHGGSILEPVQFYCGQAANGGMVGFKIVSLFSLFVIHIKSVHKMLIMMQCYSIFRKKEEKK